MLTYLNVYFYIFPKQLTKVEVLKALRGSDKVKKLLELPEKVFSRLI